MSGADRLKHATFALAGFIPVVGWAGRAAKGGKAIHSTAKGMKAVDNSLSAYQYGKSLDVLRKTEYGIYGLASANGFGEYITGKDMFGNELSEEKRNQSLTEALFVLSVRGMGMYADRLIDKNAVYSLGTNNITGITKSIDVKPGRYSDRLNYLHQKFGGPLTKEQLDIRVNLRGETVEELKKLKDSGMSKRKIGPAFAGVYDKSTGKTFYAINDFEGILPNLHPFIKTRYESMPQNVIDSYTFTKGAGSHAEVIALNKALNATPKVNPNNFVINVIRTGQNRTKPAGMMFPRCPH